MKTWRIIGLCSMALIILVLFTSMCAILQEGVAARGAGGTLPHVVHP
ncbi:hypothetical protein [Paraburkholderia franconis]|nr:hypothetical protein [Paraburkholderia franconis]